MNVEEIQKRLAARFGERIGALAPANKDAFLPVQAADIVEICKFAKEDPDLAFDCLMNLSSVDWPKKNQIEVVYHLWSYAKRHAFVLKVTLDRAQPRIARTGDKRLCLQGMESRLQPVKRHALESA